MASLYLSFLLSERSLHQRDLPLAPVEPPSITLSRDNCGVGRVHAPPCFSFNSLSIRCLSRRVHPGRSATFALVPHAHERRVEDGPVLAMLASVVTIAATLQPPSMFIAPSGRKRARLPSSTPVFAPLLPVTCKLSSHGDLLICVTAPASASEGSRLVINNVSIAGCEMALGEAPLQSIVGFNHASLPKGPVSDAAGNGDVPTLMLLLHSGASTEEKAEVSGFLSLERFLLHRPLSPDCTKVEWHLTSHGGSNDAAPGHGQGAAGLWRKRSGYGQVGEWRLRCCAFPG
jgi:hypothetical protein